MPQRYEKAVKELNRRVLNEIKSNIRKAKKYADLSVEYQQKVFELLDVIGIKPDSIATMAENADNLERVITCCIAYGEYSIEKLMKEIENTVNSME